MKDALFSYGITVTFFARIVKEMKFDGERHMNINSYLSLVCTVPVDAFGV